MAPLSITIIGAGIGGLAAAAILRRQGHKITLLERSAFLYETGAAINVGANISGILRDLGFDLAGKGAVKCQGTVRYAGSDGSTTSVFDLSKATAHWRETYYLMHRVDLHSGLKDLALDPECEGPVPELVLNSKIERIDVQSGKVKLQAGRTIVSDLIIGADGVRSTARRVIDSDAEPIPWGKSAYRWLTPREILMADDEIKHMFDRDGYFGEIYENEPRVVYYPCRNNQFINVVVFVPDELRENNPGLGNKQILLKSVEGLSSATHKMLSYADEDVKCWPLYHIEPLRKWSKGKLVLLGDALHPMLPFLGQGGAMAIEDAVTLGILFPEDATTEDLEGRLDLYQKIRHDRTTEIEWGSRVRGMPDGIRPAEFNIREAMEKAHNFNEEEHSQRELANWMSGKLEGKVAAL